MTSVNRADLAVRRPAEPPIKARDELRAAAFAGWGLLALGAPLGLLWARAVPHIQMFRIDGDPGYLLPARTEDPAAVAGDLLFTAVLLGAGVVVGLLAGFAGRRHMRGTAVGLGVGGLFGGAVAAAVGYLSVRGGYVALNMHEADGTVFTVRPLIHSHVAFLALAAGALGGFALTGLPLRRRRKTATTPMPALPQATG